MNKMIMTLLAAAACCSAYAGSKKNTSKASGLRFNADSFTEGSVTVDGTAVKYRAYENIVYVAKPVDTTYEVMNIYIPSAYFEGKSVNGWTRDTAPVFLPNQVGGYMPGLPGRPNDGTSKQEGPGPAFDGGNGGPNAIAYALSQGLVVASPGARGRTTATGRAPACIVDLKAAVRYLRYNDKAMPGNAEKIISNGTSAGGALSALLGATGDAKEYEPYLKAIGAADASDKIYAVSAYCPITNLDNADAAYEWIFSGYNDYSKFDISMLDYKVQRVEKKGTLTAGEQKVSAELKALFPPYVNSLKLASPDGTALTLDSSGNGTFKEYIKGLIAASAQKELDAGKDLSTYTFLTIVNGKVTGVDFDAYTAYAGRQKLPPAFDGLDLGTGENNLFGNETLEARHFTQFGAENNTVAGAQSADPALVAMMNPLTYIGRKNSVPASYWRIRHGTKDRDTSLAVPAILALTLEDNGYNVDFALPWDRPHSGDYDLPELFGWIDTVCRNK